MLTITHQQGQHLIKTIPLIIKKPNGQALLDRVAREIWGEGTLVSKVWYGSGGLSFYDFEVCFMLKIEGYVYEIIVTNYSITYHKHSKPAHY